jgi:uncharacterized protein (UPF0332 family)
MEFNWKEFLELAKYLNETEPFKYSQAALRTSASRAYYAAFCQARKYAWKKLKYQPIYDESDHKSLRDFFKKKNMLQLWSHLDQLRKWRNQCDYDEKSIDDLESLVKNSLKKAEFVLSKTLVL